MRRRLRVREGSIADYGRIILTSIGFWALFFAVVVTAYPV